jgi:hypothetical protein
MGTNPGRELVSRADWDDQAAEAGGAGPGKPIDTGDDRYTPPNWLDLPAWELPTTTQAAS